MSVQMDPNLTKVTFTPASGTPITFQERSVQPGGYEGSDKVDVTSSQTTAQANGVVIKSYVPGSFVELNPGGASVLYDPADEAAVLAAVNVAGSFVITFSDGQVSTAPGFIRTFVPTSQDTVGATDAWTADMVFEFSGVAVITPAAA